MNPCGRSVYHLELPVGFTYCPLTKDWERNRGGDTEFWVQGKSKQINSGIESLVELTFDDIYAIFTVLWNWLLIKFYHSLQ